MRKGFTLVEILAVLIILGILIVITVPSFMGILTDTKRTSFNSKVTEIETAALKYAEKTKDDIKNAGSSCVTTTVSNLISLGYLSSESDRYNIIYNPTDNSEMSGNIKMCYCTSSFDVEAYYTVNYNSSTVYHEDEKIVKDNKIYKCINTYPGYYEQIGTTGTYYGFEHYFEQVTC